MANATQYLRWGMLLLAVALCAGVFAHPGVRYSKQWLNRARVHVITVDLNDKTLQVKPVVGRNRPGRRQSFLGFMAEHQPLAQLTGTYFGLRNGLPIGDLLSDGRWIFDGFAGSALVITPENTAAIVNIPPRWKYSWPGYTTVIQGGIRLTQQGKYAVYPRVQGFRDTSLYRRASRTAVGIQEGNRLVLVAVNKPVLLSELAAIMKALKCRDAMTLDGGTSTGMAFGTDVILMPGRTLSNVLVVTERPVPTASPLAPALRPLTPAGETPVSYPVDPIITPDEQVIQDILDDNALNVEQGIALE